LRHLEFILGSLLTVGIMAYLLFARVIYPTYVRVRESQRRDKAERSPVQTLFPEEPKETDPPEIQTLFSDKD
jgi:hypothetical protein